MGCRFSASWSIGLLCLALGLVATPASGQEPGGPFGGVTDSRLMEPFLSSSLSVAPSGEEASERLRTRQAERVDVMEEEEGRGKDVIGAAVGGVVVGLLARGVACSVDETGGCEEGVPAFLLGFAIGAIVGAGVGSAL